MTRGSSLVEEAREREEVEGRMEVRLALRRRAVAVDLSMRRFVRCIKDVNTSDRSTKLVGGLIVRLGFVSDYVSRQPHHHADLLGLLAEQVTLLICFGLGWIVVS